MAPSVLPFDHLRAAKGTAPWSDGTDGLSASKAQAHVVPGSYLHRDKREGPQTTITAFEVSSPPLSGNATHSEAETSPYPEVWSPASSSSTGYGNAPTASSMSHNRGSYASWSSLDRSEANISRNRDSADSYHSWRSSMSRLDSSQRASGTSPAWDTDFIRGIAKQTLPQESGEERRVDVGLGIHYMGDQSAHGIDSDHLQIGSSSLNRETTIKARALPAQPSADVLAILSPRVRQYCNSPIASPSSRGRSASVGASHPSLDWFPPARALGSSSVPSLDAESSKLAFAPFAQFDELEGSAVNSSSKWSQNTSEQFRYDDEPGISAVESAQTSRGEAGKAVLQRWDLSIDRDKSADTSSRRRVLGQFVRRVNSDLAHTATMAAAATRDTWTIMTKNRRTRGATSDAGSTPHMESRGSTSSQRRSSDYDQVSDLSSSGASLRHLRGPLESQGHDRNHSASRTSSRTRSEFSSMLDLTLSLSSQSIPEEVLVQRYPLFSSESLVVDEQDGRACMDREEVVRPPKVLQGGRGKTASSTSWQDGQAQSLQDARQKSTTTGAVKAFKHWKRKTRILERRALEDKTSINRSAISSPIPLSNQQSTHGLTRLRSRSEDFLVTRSQGKGAVIALPETVGLLDSTMPSDDERSGLASHLLSTSASTSLPRGSSNSMDAKLARRRISSASQRASFSMTGDDVQSVPQPLKQPLTSRLRDLSRSVPLRQHAAGLPSGGSSYNGYAGGDGGGSSNFGGDHQGGRKNHAGGESGGGGRGQAPGGSGGGAGGGRQPNGGGMARGPGGGQTSQDVKTLFKRLELVGRGAYGAVYRGQHIPTGNAVALKVVNLDTPDDDVSDIQKEVAVLSQLREAESRNVVRYWGCWLKGPELWIVMDYAEGGSIRTLVS